MAEQPDPSDDISSAMEALWGPRTGSPPAVASGRDEPSARANLASPPPSSSASAVPPVPTDPGAPAERDPGTVREFAQIRSELAAMINVADERQAMLAGQTASEFGAIRARLEGALAEQAAAALRAGEVAQIQLAASIDGIRADVGATVSVSLIEARAEMSKAVEAQASRFDQLASVLDQRLESAAARAVELAGAAGTASVASTGAELEAFKAEMSDDAARAAASLDALRSDVDAALAESVRRAGEHAAVSLEGIEAVRGQLAVAIDGVRADTDAAVSASFAQASGLISEAADAQTSRLGRVEEQLASLALHQGDAMEAMRALLLEQVRDELQSLRAEVLAAVARQVAQAQAAAWEDAAKRQTEIEARLTTAVDSAVVAHVDVAAVRAHLEDVVSSGLMAARSELDARVVALDVMVDGVDAAMASMQSGMATQLAAIDAWSDDGGALAPIRSDLRAVQADVSDLRQFVVQLQRELRPARPTPMPSEPRAPSTPMKPPAKSRRPPPTTDRLTAEDRGAGEV